MNFFEFCFSQHVEFEPSPIPAVKTSQYDRPRNSVKAPPKKSRIESDQSSDVKLKLKIDLESNAHIDIDDAPNSCKKPTGNNTTTNFFQAAPQRVFSPTRYSIYNRKGGKTTPG